MRLLIPLLLLSCLAAREYGGQYTPERLANVRANCDKYDWGQKLRAQAVAAAKPWLEKSDDELWSMVPGQDLPRCIDVTFDRKTTGPKKLGCLVCGDKITSFGNYPYDPDFKTAPWKLKCPSCGAVFPTNDFGKFYQSGIDDRGLFNPQHADRSLLYNTSHPDPKDPLHTFGVDDGFGYVDPATGRSHRFIGYYAWKYWNYIETGLTALSEAYVYTGNKSYAHKAAVLLDRIADVYPDMDWQPYADRGWYHSDGGTSKGKIEGAIWETQDARRFSEVCDRILSGTINDEPLQSFLKSRAEKFKTPRPKGTRDLMVANWDEGLLRTIFKGVLSRQISGNEGMQQLAVTEAAIALDTEPETTQWLDWLFEPTGGALPGLLLSRLDRDGVSIEGAPGYALMWGELMSDVAFHLAEYPKYKKHDIFRDFPQFKATFLAAWRMTVTGTAMPNLGDTGTTGAIEHGHLRPQWMATGYHYTRDPEIGAAAYHANGNSAAGLGRDIYSKDPDAISAEIEKLGKSIPSTNNHSRLMTGFELAILQSGSGKDATAVALNYGRTLFHAHRDRLNFDLFAYGHWLLPDLGYPEFATEWPSRNEWNNNTISHNTVVVDGQEQQKDYGGKTRLFQSLPGLTVAEIDGGKGPYPQTTEYARTVTLIDADPGQAYLVDLFHVTGGSDHVYSIHGPPGETTVGAANMVDHPGTYAGENVPFASEEGRKYPLGYSWLYQVRRDDAPPPHFLVDWKAMAGYHGVTATDDIHVRYFGLTQCNDVAMAEGDPPQNKVGNPRRLVYLLLHRKGEPGLESRFVSVIEPCKGKGFIQNVERLQTSEEQIAIRVLYYSGQTDTILINPADGKFTAGDVTLDGKMALVRRQGGRVTKAILIEGRSLSADDMNVTATPALTGKVVRMNKELSGGGLLWVNGTLPTDGSLDGQHILIDTDIERDACYAIQHIEKDGDLWKVDCGPITFVNGYEGPTVQVRAQDVAADYSKGFTYDFKERAGYKIPLVKIAR